MTEIEASLRSALQNAVFAGLPKPKRTLEITHDEVDGKLKHQVWVDGSRSQALEEFMSGTITALAHSEGMPIEMEIEFS
jgi:hypothetical protein